MDREFLEDYERKEDEEYSRFLKRLREGKISIGERYPPEEKLQLLPPFTKAIRGRSIWPQIPLYGSTLIVLEPIKKEYFERTHGFRIDQIDRLIDFSKKTRRVQFALAESPLNYWKMDYLEPLFIELLPPRLRTIPPSFFLNEKEIIEYSQKLASDFSSQLLKNLASYVNLKYESTNPEIEKKIISAIVSDGLRLKIAGYSEEIFKEFLKQLSIIPDSLIIMEVLQNIHDIFLQPFDPLGGIISSTDSHITTIHQLFPSVISKQQFDKLEFPFEIGRFLTKKLNLIAAEDIEGAVSISDIYELYDLRKVMHALYQAVKKEKREEVFEKAKEIDYIFENVWREVSIYKKWRKISNLVIPFTLAGIGNLVSPAGALLGFISGVCLEGVEKVIESIDISGRLTEKGLNAYLKWKGKSYLLNIYDFRKKYKII